MIKTTAVVASVACAIGMALPDRIRAGDSSPEHAPVDGRASPAITLEVQAMGFDDDSGHAIALLYRPGANVLDKNAAFARATSAIHGGGVLLRFPDLAEGEYALVVFHDSNDNGIIDHNFLHLPAEQLGFSNGFHPGIFAGLPTFEKLRFRLDLPVGAEPAVLKVAVE